MASTKQDLTQSQNWAMEQQPAHTKQTTGYLFKHIAINITVPFMGAIANENADQKQKNKKIQVVISNIRFSPVP